MGLKGGGPGAEKNKIRSIFYGSKLDGILPSRQINSTSYTFITGYNKVELVGVKHKPKESILIGKSTNNKVIDCRKLSFIPEKKIGLASQPLIRYVNSSSHHSQSSLPCLVPGIQVRKLSKYQEKYGDTTSQVESEKTFEEYQKQADQGNAEKQFNLGQMYKSGQGIAKDLIKAVEWYQKAADQGHAKAQFNLAWMYKNGQGIAKDLIKAVEWYQKAADQGHAKAQFNLGVMYATGQGVTKDITKAVEWYQKAAIQGYVEAQFNLDVMYATGQGVTKDLTKAVEWYQKAATQGLAEAQFNLGGMYLDGQRITKDITKAVEWCLVLK